MTEPLSPASQRCVLLAALCFALAACGSPATGPVPSPHIVGPSGLVVSPNSLSMSPGDSATVNASEQGYDGGFSQTNDCSGIVTVGSNGNGSYSVNAVAPGTCAITVSDGKGHSTPVNVSVQTIVIGGQ